MNMVTSPNAALNGNYVNMDNIGDYYYISAAARNGGITSISIIGRINANEPRRSFVPIRRSSGRRGVNLRASRRGDRVNNVMMNGRASRGRGTSWSTSSAGRERMEERRCTAGNASDRDSHIVKTAANHLGGKGNVYGYVHPQPRSCLNAERVLLRIGTTHQPKLGRTAQTNTYLNLGN